MALAQEIRESDVALEPRGLLDNTTFDKIVSCIVKDKKVTPEYAAEMFGQTLVFLKAHADSLRSTRPACLCPTASSTASSRTPRSTRAGTPSCS